MGWSPPEVPRKKLWSLYLISAWNGGPRGAFFVRSAEVVPCPVCQGPLVVVGSRPRSVIKPTGEKTWVIIRRLRCTSCRRIHHELPDIVVPYRRHQATSIEDVVGDEQGAVSVAADESTLGRWRRWFEAWVPYATGALESIRRRLKLPLETASTSPESALQILGRFVGEGPGWLARVVRSLANMNLWVTDPFGLSVPNFVG